MNDLESRLAALPLRTAPPEWRTQILHAAQAARPAENPAPWWRAWLTPPRLALSGAWLAILLLRLTAPGTTRPAARSDLADWRQLWAARQEMVARLLAPPAPPETTPPFHQGALWVRRPDQFA